jgi:hypothetical protein
MLYTCFLDNHVREKRARTRNLLTIFLRNSDSLAIPVRYTALQSDPRFACLTGIYAQKRTPSFLANALFSSSQWTFEGQSHLCHGLVGALGRQAGRPASCARLFTDCTLFSRRIVGGWGTLRFAEVAR